MNYQDKWTRYHHKPTDGINPSSGNGFLYTAYAVKVELKIDKIKLKECWELCSQNNIFIRNPYKETSPFSRDEYIGCVALGILKEQKTWNYSPFLIPEFSLFELLKQTLELYKNREDRNYFWKNHLNQIYRFSFSVPVVDRYFILQKWGKFKAYKPSHLLYWGIAQIDKLGKPSGIRFLKYGGEKNKKAMLEEFPDDHPVRA